MLQMNTNGQKFNLINSEGLFWILVNQMQVIDLIYNTYSI
jgi:hypothetical protein